MARMDAFWEGVLAGYGIAIPVGAIAILIVDMGLRRGFPPAFMAGAGAATADFVYALLAVIAGAALAAALAPYAAVLQIASAIVLLTLGAYGLRQAWQIKSEQSTETAVEENRSLWGIYLRFLGLTLLNPLTIAYFGALILGRDAGATIEPLDRLLFVLGAALASLSWQTLLASLGSLANQRLSPRFQRATSIAGNFIVIVLGLRIILTLQ
jgi:threonine/homoserine/homoserine lactone efflux protein